MVSNLNGEIKPSWPYFAVIHCNTWLSITIVLLLIVLRPFAIVSDCIPSYEIGWNTIVIPSHVLRRSVAGYVSLIERVQSYTVVCGFRNLQLVIPNIKWNGNFRCSDFLCFRSPSLMVFLQFQIECAREKKEKSRQKWIIWDADLLLWVLHRFR